MKTLVRETGQNTSDAPAYRGAAVHLGFTLIELPVGGDAFERFARAVRFDELIAHIKATAATNSKLATRLNAGLRVIGEEERLYLLRVDDFLTTGLFGDEVREDEAPNPFAALLRNNMDSSKESQTAGGAFGLGKAVLWRCSTLSTVLVASEVDPQRMPDGAGHLRFMGKSELGWHSIDGNQFAGPGWYGKQAGERTDSVWLARETLRDVYLSRESLPDGIPHDQRTGSSLLVVGFRDPAAEGDPRPDDLLDTLEREISLNFWPAIASSRLRASVSLVRDDQVVKYREVNPSKTVRSFVQVSHKNAADETVEELLETGDVVRRNIAFTVPATVASAASSLREFGTDLEATCYLLVRLSDNADEESPEEANLEGTVALVRGRGMVVRYWPRKNLVVAGRRFHAALFAGERITSSIEQIAADQFLRLAEPPAHDRWEWNDELKDKYRRGAKGLLNTLFDDVSKTLRSIVKPVDTASDDGPEDLRNLLVLKTPGQISQPILIRRVSHKIVDRRWVVDAELHINDRSRAWVVRPRIALDTESGSKIPLEWNSLRVKRVVKGQASMVDESQIHIKAGTTRLEIEGTSQSHALGVPADECRVRLDLHVEESES
ncbi:MAG TPA: hypothetical protein VE974_04600 [Thermoanaerobaculia bacterium]|nr:hypothetical protein [Thermoanaerobaculia bacterium]